MKIRLKFPCLQNYIYRLSFTYVKTLVLITLLLFGAPLLYMFRSVMCYQTPVNTVCQQVRQGLAIGEKMMSNDSK